jgi:hypothetical protein
MSRTPRPVVAADPLTAAAEEIESEARVTTVRRYVQQAAAEHDGPDTPNERRTEIQGCLSTLLERTRAGIAELERSRR